MKMSLRGLSKGECTAARSKMDRQEYELFITLPITKDR